MKNLNPGWKMIIALAIVAVATWTPNFINIVPKTKYVDNPQDKTKIKEQKVTIEEQEKLIKTLQTELQDLKKEYHNFKENDSVNVFETIIMRSKYCELKTSVEINPYIPYKERYEQCMKAERWK